jgi:hypothetical protein
MLRQEKSQLYFLEKKLQKKLKLILRLEKNFFKKLFLKYNFPPFFVEDDFKSLEMTNYFNEYFYA